MRAGLGINALMRCGCTVASMGDTERPQRPLNGAGVVRCPPMRARPKVAIAGSRFRAVARPGWPYAEAGAGWRGSGGQVSGQRPIYACPYCGHHRLQHAARAWPLWLDHRADPEAVVPVPLRRVLQAMVPAVGTRVDRPLTAHLPSGSSPSGSRSSVRPAGPRHPRKPEAAIATLGWALIGGQQTTPAPFPNGAGVVLHPPTAHASAP